MVNDYWITHKCSVCGKEVNEKSKYNYRIYWVLVYDEYDSDEDEFVYCSEECFLKEFMEMDISQYNDEEEFYKHSYQINFLDSIVDGENYQEFLKMRKFFEQYKPTTTQGLMNFFKWFDEIGCYGATKPLPQG